MAIATWRTDGWLRRALPHVRGAYGRAIRASRTLPSHSAMASAPVETLTCPSAPLKEDARLLGIVGASGRVGLLDPAPRVSAAFVEAAQMLHPSETRFRFADRCVGSKCRWWADHQCGLAEMLVTFEDAVVDELPSCPIRSTCRWFSQSGARACAVCPSVVADLRVDMVAVSDVAPGGGGRIPALSPSPTSALARRVRGLARVG